MDVIFGIFLALNLANPETREFINKTIDNNKKYECRFVYKGLSTPKDRPAITVFGYSAFKQVCNNEDH